MKKRFLFLTILLALALTSVACAGTIVNEPDRHIVPAELGADGNFAPNPVIEGESPVTGLPWTGRYQPVLVQVDNATGGVESVVQWGINEADVMYETLLHANGTTRISALFSDHMPEAVGPVRSARIGHVWIRQEWQAAFCFYGCQTKAGTNVRQEFADLGLRSDWNILNDGTAGTNKPWKKYYTKVARLVNPHNKEVNVGAIQSLVDPAVYSATPRPFKFTDSKPVVGEFADYIWIENPRKVSVSPSYAYNVEENTYYRYVGGLPYYDKDLGPDEGHQSYANVIVQRCDTSFANGTAAPLTPVALRTGATGGNAEIFTGGRYIAGYWMRTGMDERTVFLDAEGHEISLQRGKTFIQIVDNKAEVTYSCDEATMNDLLAEAREQIEKERLAGPEDDTDEDEAESSESSETEPVEEVVRQDGQTEQVRFETQLTGKATGQVKVRKGPSTEDGVVDTLKKGARVTVLGETGDWYIIRYQKKDCYVMKEYIEIVQ